MIYSIGQAPYDETWAQRDTPNYVLEAGNNCLRYIKLLKDTFGPPPNTAQYLVVEEDGCLNVQIEFDPNIQEESQYAEKVGEGVATWTQN